MQNNSQKISRIILTILFGVILTGAGNFLWWYFVTYKFYSGESGLGVTFSKKSSALFMGVFIAIFGIVNGGILGLIIGAGNLNRIQSVLVGALVNGFVIILFFSLMDAKSVKDLSIGLAGDFVVGGVVGLILVQLVTLVNKKAENKLL
jgi:hypothetical protein